MISVLTVNWQSFGLKHRLEIALIGAFHKTHVTSQTIFKKSWASIPDFSLQNKKLCSSERSLPLTTNLNANIHKNKEDFIVILGDLDGNIQKFHFAAQNQK